MGGTQSKCSGKHVYFSLFLTSVMLIAQRLAAYSARAVSTSAQTAVGSCTRKLWIFECFRCMEACAMLSSACRAPSQMDGAVRPRGLQSLAHSHCQASVRLVSNRVA